MSVSYHVLATSQRPLRPLLVPRGILQLIPSNASFSNRTNSFYHQDPIAVHVR